MQTRTLHLHFRLYLLIFTVLIGVLTCINRSSAEISMLAHKAITYEMRRLRGMMRNRPRIQHLTPYKIIDRLWETCSASTIVTTPRC